jgi:hypothetical protein
MPIEAHLHYDPFWSMVVVFGVDLALPLLLALGFVIGGQRSEGDERGAYFWLARWTIVACVIMQLLCASYHARLFAGTAEVGTVTQKEEIASSRYPQCELTLQTAHGELELDVPQGSCRNLSMGASVPIITVAGSTMFAQVGERATANAGLVLGIGPLMLLVILWVLIRTPARREH